MSTRGLREQFELLMDLPEEERGGAIARMCGGDAARAAMLKKMVGFADAEGDKGDGGAGGDGAEVVRWVGRVVGGFEVVGECGRGGMSYVFVAEQAEPARRVALKVLREDLIGKPEGLHFEREGQMLAGLDHPALPVIYAAGREVFDGHARPWMAMELVEGARDVVSYARGEGFDGGWRGRVELVISAAEGVGYLHSKGVFHRDLKPGNILVGRDGRIRLIDLGIVQTELDVDQVRLVGHRRAMGSIAYVCPALLSGELSRECAATDVYSLGVVLYEVLTGGRPYPGLPGTPSGVVEHVRGHAVELPSHADGEIPRRLDAVVMRAIAPSPRDRYGSCEELIEDLWCAVAGRSLSSERRTRVGRVRSEVVDALRLHTGAFVGLFVVVVLLGVGVGFAVDLAARERTQRGALSAAEEAIERSSSSISAIEMLLEEALAPSRGGPTPGELTGGASAQRTIVAALADRLEASMTAKGIVFDREEGPLAPEVEARLRLLVAGHCAALGMADRVERLLGEAIVILQGLDPTPRRELGRAYLLMSQAYIELGRPAEGQRYAQRASELLPESSVALGFDGAMTALEAGEKLLGTGRYSEAIAQFERAASAFRALDAEVWAIEIAEAEARAAEARGLLELEG